MTRCQTKWKPTAVECRYIENRKGAFKTVQEGSNREGTRKQQPVRGVVVLQEKTQGWKLRVCERTGSVFQSN